MKKKKGFTLIELVAVLVIMAILALIVTPLVMNIIRKARVSADKRSIDAYGRSIELAIASYLLDTGKFPTSVEQLTIEYGGSEVVCETTQLNSDSSVYLTGCRVAGRSIDYEYRTLRRTPTYQAYSVGAEINYNGEDYYVIENSGTNESTVKLLKAEPLTVEEISDYKPAEAQTSTNDGGYIGMNYGTTSDYSTSYVKTTVDAWKQDKVPAASEARLITIDDLKNSLGYELNVEATSESYLKTESTPNWVYNRNYWYWLSTPFQDSPYVVLGMDIGGSFLSAGVNDSYGVVRPVIVLPKSVL